MSCQLAARIWAQKVLWKFIQDSFWKAISWCNITQLPTNAKCQVRSQEERLVQFFAVKWVLFNLINKPYVAVELYLTCLLLTRQLWPSRLAKNNARSHLMCITRAAPAWFEWSEHFKLFDWVEFCQRLFFEPTARKIILQNSTKSKS